MGQKQTKLEKGDVDVNIALIGDSGSEKSSFINAIKRLDDDDKLAEQTGVSKLDTTTESSPMSYSHPKNSHIKLCNLPGLGTPTYPDVKSYFEKLNLEAKYDAFLIFTSEMFSKNDLSLAQQLQSMNKPLFMIRTKIDLDLQNERKKRGFNENVVLEQIRGKILKSLKGLNCSGEEVFLISNHEREKWDFPRLNGKILNFFSQYNIDNDTKGAMLEHLNKHLHEAKSTIKKKGINAAQKLMDEQLIKWEDIDITLAVTGQSGCGKSSFINSIRRLKDDEEGSAPTGVTETTMDPEEYSYPSNKRIKLWDLPGVGTIKFSDLTSYYSKVNIAKYDAFIIMSSERFTKIDADLAKKLVSMNKPFFFVRSKVDNSSSSEKNKKYFDEKKMLQKIRTSCSNNIKDLKISTFDIQNIFLVNNKNPQEYDFPRLTNAISNQLPFAKQESFNLSIYILSEDVLKRKVKTLKGRVRLVALRSILVTALTKKSYSRKVNFDYISKYVKFCESHLGLPDKESREFQGMTEELQTEVQKVTTDLLEKLSGRFNADKVECSSAANAIDKPYSLVYRSLNDALDEMEKVALGILKDADRKTKELQHEQQDCEDIQ